MRPAPTLLVALCAVARYAWGQDAEGDGDAGGTRAPFVGEGISFASREGFPDRGFTQPLPRPNMNWLGTVHNGYSPVAFDDGVPRRPDGSVDADRAAFPLPPEEPPVPPAYDPSTNPYDMMHHRGGAAGQQTKVVDQLHDYSLPPKVANMQQAKAEGLQPTVLRAVPRVGPIDGGQTVVIEGVALGFGPGPADDIEAISLAGVACTNVREATPEDLAAAELQEAEGDFARTSLPLHRVRTPRFACCARTVDEAEFRDTYSQHLGAEPAAEVCGVVRRVEDPCPAGMHKVEDGHSFGEAPFGGGANATGCCAWFAVPDDGTAAATPAFGRCPQPECASALRQRDTANELLGAAPEHTARPQEDTAVQLLEMRATLRARARRLSAVTLGGGAGGLALGPVPPPPPLAQQQQPAGTSEAPAGEAVLQAPEAHTFALLKCVTGSSYPAGGQVSGRVVVTSRALGTASLGERANYAFQPDAVLSELRAAAQRDREAQQLQALEQRLKRQAEAGAPPAGTA